MVISAVLKARAKLMGIRQANIARALGIKQPTVNQKLNNIRPMGVREAEQIARILGISNETFAFYFFWDGVDHRRVQIVRVRRKQKGRECDE